MGVFSSLYLNSHRSSFKELALDTHSENQLQLVFNQQDFSKIAWTEKGREFEWQGKMYDVSSIRKIKEGYLILCINDEEEESLIALFNTWKKSNTCGGNLKFQLQPQFCNDLVSYSTEPVSSNPANYSLAINFYNSPCDQADSPPPEYFS